VHCAKGFRDETGHVRWRIDATGPLGEGAEDAELVGDFVEHAVAAADVVAVELAGEAEDRGIGGVGGGEGGGGVEESGAGDDYEDAGIARGEGVTEGHVGCALLVARVDDAHAVAGVVDGCVEVVVLYAGEAEDGVDAVGEESVNKRFAAGSRRVHRAGS